MDLRCRERKRRFTNKKWEAPHGNLIPKRITFTILLMNLSSKRQDIGLNPSLNWIHQSGSKSDSFAELQFIIIFSNVGIKTKLCVSIINSLWNTKLFGFFINSIQVWMTGETGVWFCEISCLEVWACFPSLLLNHSATYCEVLTCNWGLLWSVSKPISSIRCLRWRPSIHYASMLAKFSEIYRFSWSF